MSKSLVKDSVVLREEILKRIKELGLNFTKVCQDAEEKGYKISISALSRYFSNSEKNKLSEEDIVWLSYRFGVFTHLSIGIPQIIEQKIRWVITPYNEEQCLKMLKMVFPDMQSIRHNSILTVSSKKHFDYSKNTAKSKGVVKTKIKSKLKK